MNKNYPKPKSDLTTSKRTKSTVHFYPPEEEKYNIITHGLGFVLSIVGTYFLILKAQGYEQQLHFWSFLIYGFSLMCLYAASTLYHSATKPNERRILNIVDHSAIFLLIAGSYTPFTLITLAGSSGAWLFWAIWSLAITGIILKLFFTGKYDKLSTIMYVLISWIAIFAIKPLIENLDLNGLLLVGLGGIFYTVGAGFYSLKSMRFNHAIFHLFVLGGSLCHYIAIFLFV